MIHGRGELFNRSEDSDLWPALPPNGYGDIKTNGRLAESPHHQCAWREAFKEFGDGTAWPDMVGIRALRRLIWLQTEKALQHWRKPTADYVVPTELAREPLTRPFTMRNVSRDLPERHCRIEVVQRDILEMANELVAKGFKKVAVLNMANPSIPGGGYRSGAGAQEENLHRRSDAVRFTVQQSCQNYPIPETACLVSEDVTVFRGTEKDGYPFLDRPFQITLLSIAAVRNPRLTRCLEYADPNDRRLMKTKVRLIVHAAVQTGCDAVVLSAFGCGAFGNPPDLVAQMFLQELQRASPPAAFFCILDDHNARRFHNPHGNFQPFLAAFSPSRA